jgi:hypothetical protein
MSYLDLIILALAFVCVAVPLCIGIVMLVEMRHSLDDAVSDYWHNRVIPIEPEPTRYAVDLYDWEDEDEWNERIPEFFILGGHLVFAVKSDHYLPIHDGLGHAAGPFGYCDCGV